MLSSQNGGRLHTSDVDHVRRHIDGTTMIFLLFAAASFNVRRVPRQQLDACRTGMLRLSERFDIDEAMSAMDKAVSAEDYAEAARLKKLIDAQVAEDRARLTRQIMGDDTPSTQPTEDAPTVSIATTLAAGQILVASPERFCSRNPFAWPPMDMSRFGIDGPVKFPGLPADIVATRLPVLVLIEHNDQRSRALLLEQRTGALMGDVSMENFGPCAICPLWFGGSAKDKSLYIIHDVPEAADTTQIASGLFQGGWDDLKPKVADSSVSEARIKFFVGVTEWKKGQLEEELKAGAWLALDVPPSLVVKDRVSDWRPGKPKPVWTEMLNYLPDDEGKIKKLIDQIYDDE